MTDPWGPQLQLATYSYQLRSCLVRTRVPCCFLRAFWMQLGPLRPNIIKFTNKGQLEWTFITWSRLGKSSLMSLLKSDSFETTSLWVSVNPITTQSITLLPFSVALPVEVSGFMMRDGARVRNLTQIPYLHIGKDVFRGGFICTISWPHRGYRDSARLLGNSWTKKWGAIRWKNCTETLKEKSRNSFNVNGRSCGCTRTADTEHNLAQS